VRISVPLLQTAFFEVPPVCRALYFASWLACFDSSFYVLLPSTVRLVFIGPRVVPFLRLGRFSPRLRPQIELLISCPVALSVAAPSPGGFDRSRGSLSFIALHPCFGFLVLNYLGSLSPIRSFSLSRKRYPLFMVSSSAELSDVSESPSLRGRNRTPLFPARLKFADRLFLVFSLRVPRKEGDPPSSHPFSSRDFAPRPSASLVASIRPQSSPLFFGRDIVFSLPDDFTPGLLFLFRFFSQHLPHSFRSRSRPPHQATLLRKFSLPSLFFYLPFGSVRRGTLDGTLSEPFFHPPTRDSGETSLQLPSHTSCFPSRVSLFFF